MAGSFFPPQGGGASSFSQIQGTIAASQIPNSIVVDSMVAAAAGIQESKLAALGTSKALVTDGSGFIIVHPSTTSTEIGYVNGVTSAIQTQLNATEKTANKGAISGYAGLNASQQITNNLANINQLPALATSVVVVTTAGGVLTTANPTVTEVNFLSGVTSAIQTQLNGKQASLGYTAENTANKGAASGYAGLNGSSQITNSLANLNQLPALNNSIVVVTTGAGVLTSSSVTTTTLGFLDATSSIQTQLNGKATSGSALTESAEQNSTPVVDDTESAINNGDAAYSYFTVPNTYKFIIITGIEWKNGTAVAGNVMCGADIVDANPPTVAPRSTIAFGRQIAQSGTNAVQRNSSIVCEPIRANTVIGVWIQTDTNTTPKFRYKTATQSNNRSAVTYSANVPNGRTTAFTTDSQPYIKIYYVGYT